MSDDLRGALKTRGGRRRLADGNFYWWSVIYMGHYMKLPAAEFHADLAATLQDWTLEFVDITGFRGGAKSTYVATFFPLWAVLTGRSHFAVIITETGTPTTLNISDIRAELEANELLIGDYGDQSYHISKQREWTKQSLLLAAGARILGRSRGQRIRGLRHGKNRPDLVIIDDPEEREKVRQKEYREKTKRWLWGDVVPAIQEGGARLIVAGNLLHHDALMATLSRHELFHHRRYALVAEDGHCTWPAMFPTREALEKQKAKVGYTAWMREYELKVIPEEGQPVKPEWIQHYKELPAKASKSGVGVDLAISKKSTADYTAMVGGLAVLPKPDEHGGRAKIYIMPHPLEARLSFHETLEQMRSMMLGMGKYGTPMFAIEDVAYQKAAVEAAESWMMPVRPMTPGTDKRARLLTVAGLIQNGTILFPEKGCEDLIAQLIGFGVEDHDDLVDAFVYLITMLMQDGLEMPEVIAL